MCLTMFFFGCVLTLQSICFRVLLVQHHQLKPCILVIKVKETMKTVKKGAESSLRQNLMYGT